MYQWLYINILYIKKIYIMNIRFKKKNRELQVRLLGPEREKESRGKKIRERWKKRKFPVPYPFLFSPYNAPLPLQSPQPTLPESREDLRKRYLKYERRVIVYYNIMFFRRQTGLDRVFFYRKIYNALSDLYFCDGIKKMKRMERAHD